MGNTVAWFTATGATRATKVDLGRRIHMREGPSPVYRQAVEEAFGGGQSVTIFGGRERVRLRHTWTRDGAGDGDRQRRRLQALVAHLQRGGTCMIAEDSATAFAAFATTSPSNGDTTFQAGANLFDNFGSVSSLNNREVVLHTQPDTFFYEMKLVTGSSLASIGLTEKVFADMTLARWCLLREIGSYPALRIPFELRESGDFLVHDHEWLFTLDLPLETDVDTLESMWLLDGAGVPDDDGGLGIEWGTLDVIDIGVGGLGGGPGGVPWGGSPGKGGGLGGW